MTDEIESTKASDTPEESDLEKIRHRAIKRTEGIVALSVLVGMGVCARVLEAMRTTDDPLVRSALFSGLVVNYARAFENAVDAATQAAKRFGVRRLSAPFDKNLHNALLSLRNEQIAHAGHVLNDYNLTFMSMKKTIATQEADGTITKSEKRHLIGTRARASLACGPATLETHEKLLAHVRALESEAAQRLSVAIIEHDEASVFRLEQLADGRNVFETLKSKQFTIMGPTLVLFGEEDLAISLANTPDAMPLAFAVMHYHVAEKDGAFTLEGLTVEE